MAPNGSPHLTLVTRSQRRNQANDAANGDVPPPLQGPEELKNPEFVNETSAVTTGGTKEHEEVPPKPHDSTMDQLSANDGKSDDDKPPADESQETEAGQEHDSEEEEEEEDEDQEEENEEEQDLELSDTGESFDPTADTEDEEEEDELDEVSATVFVPTAQLAKWKFPVTIKTDLSDYGFGFPTAEEVLVPVDVHFVGTTGLHFRCNEPSDLVLQFQATVLSYCAPTHADGAQKNTSLRDPIRRAINAMNRELYRPFVGTFGVFESLTDRAPQVYEHILKGYATLPNKETFNRIMFRTLYYFAVIRLGMHRDFLLHGDEWDAAVHAVHRVYVHGMNQTLTTKLTSRITMFVLLFKEHLLHRGFPELITRRDDEQEGSPTQLERQAHTNIRKKKFTRDGVTSEVVYGVESRTLVKKKLIQLAMEYEEQHAELFRDEIQTVQRSTAQTNKPVLFTLADAKTWYAERQAKHASRTPQTTNKKRKRTDSASTPRQNA